MAFKDKPYLPYFYTSTALPSQNNNVPAGGFAKLLKENEFATKFSEGERSNVHIQLVGNRAVLVVLFDSKSSLGLVRLRVRKASEEITHILEALVKRTETDAVPIFAEITDEDIDNLFKE
ncbi:hypothetical protein MY4038_005168 [Beauveria bassiana]